MPLVFVLLFFRNIGAMGFCIKVSLSTPHRMIPSNSHSQRTCELTVAHDPQDRVTAEGRHGKAETYQSFQRIEGTL